MLLANSVDRRKHDSKIGRERKKVAERLTEEKQMWRQVFFFFPIKQCKESCSEKIAWFLRIVTSKPCKENACMHTAIQVKSKEQERPSSFPKATTSYLQKNWSKNSFFVIHCTHTMIWSWHWYQEVHFLPTEAKLHS